MGMLTENELQTPEWLATLVSGQCVVIRGYVGAHRLEGLKKIFPLGALQWMPVELPQGEALDPEFFASIMPALLGEVPRKVYVMPLVASTVQLDALAEVRANQPWLQWIAFVPDPEINPVLPEGILLFDAKARRFAREDAIDPNALAWARSVLAGARSEEERKRAVSLEGPKILATINAISAGEYQSLPVLLGKCDTSYVTQLVTIASNIGGVEGVDPAKIAAEVAETADIDDIITQNAGVRESPCEPSRRSQISQLSQLPQSTQPASQTSGAQPRSLASHPQIFERGKAIPMYAPGDPAGKYAREMDVVRRDPEVHGALLELLQELPCQGEDNQPSRCAGNCHDPVQKWACLRENAWQNGVPAAIVDQWLEMFARGVTRVGRISREAYISFSNVVLQASAANPTFSETEFAGMVRKNEIPVKKVLPETQPVGFLQMSPKPRPAKVAAPAKPTPRVSSIPFLDNSKTHIPSESRAPEICARLDAVAERVARLAGRLRARVANALVPRIPNVRRKEADDPESMEELTMDALEKRIARLASGK